MVPNHGNHENSEKIAARPNHARTTGEPREPRQQVTAMMRYYRAMAFTKKNAKRIGKKAGMASGKARRKKAVKVQAAAAPGPPMPTSGVDRQSLLQVAAWWVLSNDIDAKPPDALHKNLQTMWKRGDTSFVRSLLAPTGKGTQYEDFDDGDESEYLATIDKMLADISATTARNQKLMRLLEAWEPRLVATQHRAEQPTELWMELAAIFRAPLRPAARDGAALSPGSQSPLVQPPPGTNSASQAR